MPTYYRRPVNEFYHHGIKGMRWGVRRFQKKDGTLTAEGKKRYSGEKIPEKKSTHRQNLEKKYRDQGMSKKDAEQVAAKRIKAEKYVAAAAGVTLAACAAYMAYRGYAVDKKLGGDTQFQRIMSTRPGEAFQMRDGRVYVAYDKRDRARYKGLLGKSFADRGLTVRNVSMKYTDGVKVASRKRAEDTFVNLYRNDTEFRKAFDKSMSELSTGLAGQKTREMARQAVSRSSSGKISDHFLRTKGYDIFNVGLVNNSPAGQSSAEKFYAALRKQGISAIEDVNDKKYSGYRSKHPLIVFAGKYNWEADVMSNDQIQANFNRAYKTIAREQIVEAGAKQVALCGGLGLAGFGATRITQQNMVNSYRSEHPNTRMTDQQIIDMMTK